MDQDLKHAPEVGRPLLSAEVRQVWTIVWPVILTNLLNVSVGIIDFKMVGSLGVIPIAAVGVANHVMMLLMVLMIAISGGSSVLVAHAYGAGDKRLVSLLAGRSIALMLGSALLLITPFGLVFSRPLLASLGAIDRVVDAGASYMRILFLGCMFTMFNFALTGILLGVGKTKVSLLLLAAVNLLNIALNAVFIFGLGPIPPLGVPGAALGTVMARATGSLIGMWILVTPRLPIQLRPRDCLAVDLPVFRQILYLGGPRSLQGIVRNFSRLMLIRIITLLPQSTQAISAFSVAMQVRMISTFVGLAFMAAATARVGQNMGAAKPERAEQSGWICAAMAMTLMSVIAVVFFAIPDLIMGFFTDDVAVIALGRRFFRIIALAEPVMAFSFAMSGGLRGAGDPLSPFIYASVSELLVVTATGYFLAIPCGLGFSGIAIGLALSALTHALPTMETFRRGKWKNIRLYGET